MVPDISLGVNIWGRCVPRDVHANVLAPLEDVSYSGVVDLEATDESGQGSQVYVPVTGLGAFKYNADGPASGPLVAQVIAEGNVVGKPYPSIAVLLGTYGDGGDAGGSVSVGITYYFRVNGAAGQILINVQATGAASVAVNGPGTANEEFVANATIEISSLGHTEVILNLGVEATSVLSDGVS